ncbi:hypothetical protein [Bythopirellula goksoeyrii]|uniref:Uncharacterized protein n=1 Tax=Bythopirellula goksoeyrii TaxID=1400387 RepID=A0A5B9QTF6_9BACT|nr:hypothetical protein [Bythopirellula goksoeyrii]QEG37203.1 hypothetical protein Pr1d_45440 [Bythopirellula goksoeyrii]
MFNRCDISKRVIALLGVVLALSSGFQSVHWVCALGGCEIAALETHTAAETHACCHSHDCHASKVATPAESDPSHDCPCPPECWCHQAPQPLELPRTAPEPTELLLQGFVCNPASTIVMANCDFLSSQSAAGAIEDAVETSAERCAHLCRFLI